MQINPQSTALIVVHCQGHIVGPDGAFSELFYGQVVERNIVSAIERLADAFRTAGSAVFYTRAVWKPDFSDLDANSPILGIVATSGCLKDGDPLSEIVAPLAPRECDTVITHTRVGGFQGSELDEALRSRGISTVCFAGVATNFSVEGTARTASDLGYRVVIVEDACSARDEATHLASIDSLSLLAEIATADELESALAPSRRNP
ncbi:isochorismatase family cysteine hydrolase [Mycolicibacterium sp. CBM1]